MDRFELLLSLVGLDRFGFVIVLVMLQAAALFLLWNRLSVLEVVIRQRLEQVLNGRGEGERLPRLAHNQETAGSTPAAATSPEVSRVA